MRLEGGLIPPSHLPTAPNRHMVCRRASRRVGDLRLPFVLTSFGTYIIVLKKGQFTTRPQRPTDVRSTGAQADFGIIGRPVIAWFLAFGTVTIGAVLSLWPKEVLDGTKSVFSSLILVRFQDLATEWLVVAFWLGTLLWAYLLYGRLRVDHQSEDNRIAEVLRAVHRVPNYQVVLSYPEWYQQAADAIARTAEHKGEPQELLIELEVGIQAVLTLVAGMASEFARASDGTSYGANIMLFARPATSVPPLPPFDSQVLESLKFYDSAGGNLASLLAVLYLPEALLLGHIPGRPERKIPLISLPVPTAPKTKDGVQLALPGAPWAALTGTQSVAEDTHKLADECSDFAKPIINEIKTYFGDGGEGKDARSFVSFRIGDAHSPIGVLNIDSNTTFVLGTEPEYYASFFALVTPILRLLRKPVKQYAELSSAQGLFIRKAAPKAPDPKPGEDGASSGTHVA